MAIVSASSREGVEEQTAALASDDWDSVVVGAGPAGAAAAITLARRGRKVLIVDREHFPRDKSCGDGITRSGISQLDALGVLPKLAGSQQVHGVRVHMRGHRFRDFPYEKSEDYGMVVPRLLLDAKILETAVEAGAAFVGGCRADGIIWDGAEPGVVAGVKLRTEARQTQSVSCYTVIAADGATSRLAKEAGLRTMPELGYGTALRGYLEGCGDRPPMLEISMPLSDITDRYLLPSYGWMFPTEPHGANVGVGLFCREFDTNVRTLFDQFLENLRHDFPQFRQAKLKNGVLGAPLRFDFEPERCAIPGLLLVGDAAGLISPFTGEGISFALESGVLAAEVIDRCLRSGTWPGLAADDYRLLIGDRFAGYFSLGIRASRRYELIWRVLDDTFESEIPAHHLLRRAILVPEGTGEDVENSLLDDVSALVRLPDKPLAGDVAAVGSALNDIVREDWPFLTRMSFVGKRTDLVAFRPSLLLLIASYMRDSDQDVRRAAATSLELAYLGFLSQSGVRGAVSGDHANWGDKIAVLVADYLLAKSHEVGSQHCIELLPRIMEGMATACGAHVGELQEAWSFDLSETARIEQMRRGAASLFRLPCELGAELAGVPEWVEPLGNYGERLGLAYLLTEEDRALRSRPGSAPLASDLSCGILSVPVLRTLSRLQGAGEELLRDAERDRDHTRFLQRLQGAGGFSDCRELAAAFRDDAVTALNALPPSAERRALVALAQYAVARDPGRKHSLSDLMLDD